MYFSLLRKISLPEFLRDAATITYGVVFFRIRDRGPWRAEATATVYGPSRQRNYVDDI